MNGVMSIAKASLRNAVRRKWKFALVVFLFGAAVAVLTHAYDMAETFERIQAVSQQIESEGAEPSGEQVEAMARGAAAFALFSLLNLAFGFGTILFAFLMPGGIVAHERRSGAIMLWAQHPMPLRSFYLQRYVGIQVATFAALAIFGLTGAVAALPPGAAPATELGGVVNVCLTGVLACAISFAITALGIRRAALIGLLYYLLSGAVAALLGNPPFRDFDSGGIGPDCTAVRHLSRWRNRRSRGGFRVRRGLGLGSNGIGRLSLRPVDRHRVARAPQDREAAAEAVTQGDPCRPRQSPCVSRIRRRTFATITTPTASPPPSNASAGVSAPCSPSAALSPPPQSMPIRAASRALTTMCRPRRNLLSEVSLCLMLSLPAISR